MFNKDIFKTNSIKATLNEGQRTLVITQHGEAKAVLQDITSYEQTKESLALLKMLSQSSKCIRERRSKPVKTALADIRKRIKDSTG